MSYVKLDLGKEDLLKLLGDNEELNVSIQKSALNYLRNCRLKPLGLDIIRQEMDGFKTQLKSLVSKEIKDSGFNIKKIIHDEAIPHRVWEIINKKIDNMISEKINNILDNGYIDLANSLNKRIVELRGVFENRLDSLDLKELAKEVLREKVNKLF